MLLLFNFLGYNWPSALTLFAALLAMVVSVKAPGKSALGRLTSHRFHRECDRRDGRDRSDLAVDLGGIRNLVSGTRVSGVSIRAARGRPGRSETRSRRLLAGRVVDMGVYPLPGQVAHFPRPGDRATRRSGPAARTPHSVLCSRGLRVGHLLTRYSQISSGRIGGMVSGLSLRFRRSAWTEATLRPPSSTS